MSNPLRKILEEGVERSIDKWDHYLPLYHKYFDKYRTGISPENKLIIIEIGVQNGGSLIMWNKYFGKENCEIYGVDIDPRCKSLETENIHIFIGDQEDITFLEHLKANIPAPHIIIDDGGHFMKQQINTYKILFPYLRDGGMYLCEDTHTSYWGFFHGGYKNPASFIEFSKNIIDDINGYHNNNQVNENTKTVAGIYFHDSMVFVEKTLKSMERPTSKIWPGIMIVPR